MPRSRSREKEMLRDAVLLANKGNGKWVEACRYRGPTVAYQTARRLNTCLDVTAVVACTRYEFGSSEVKPRGSVLWVRTIPTEE